MTSRSHMQHMLWRTIHLFEIKYLWKYLLEETNFSKDWNVPSFSFLNRAFLTASIMDNKKKVGFYSLWYFY